MKAKRKSKTAARKATLTSSDRKLLSSVVDFYRRSRDFNGLPIQDLLADEEKSHRVKESLRRLVLAGNVSLVLGGDNPHILAFKPRGSLDEQAARLDQPQLFGCAYPTPAVLSEIVSENEYNDRPFSRRLALGEPQLGYHAFDLAVLETYRNDPRYHCDHDDIRGWISIRDAHYFSDATHERDKISLETFGFGYDKEFNRAIVVFTRYLHDLSPEHQQIWNAKLLSGDYTMHPDYFRNSILGEWGTKLSLFDAFIQELKHINAMCKLIGKPPLFRDEFAKRPAGFAFLIRPTSKEFNDFVLLLDQMMSDNINKKFFEDDIALETETVRNDGKIVVTSKGTIKLLDEWFGKIVRLRDPSPFEEMVHTFRDVRNRRQKPAHKPENSKFDQGIFKEQRQLSIKAYKAVQTIRLMLALHPATRNYEVPEHLANEEIWMF